MKGIEPWLDTGAPPDVAECLQAARAEAPRPAVVERCVALIGAGGAAALSSSVAGAVVSGAGGKTLGTALFVKSVLVGLATGVVLAAAALLPRASAPAVAVPPPTSRPWSVHSGTSAPPIRLAAPPPASVEASPARSAPVKRTFAPTDDERLAAELSLLSGVRAAIDRRDADTALLQLAEHARRYAKDARLLPEARYLRLEALELAGHREEAREVARRILETDPRGPHSARARAILNIE